MVYMKGLGSVACIDSEAGGRRCQRMEVEGMEFCLKHMPDSLLAEAEAVTGVKRCRRDGCREYANADTDPPACKSHTPARLAKAAVTEIQRQAVDLAGEIIRERAADLEHPDPVTDPYGDLMAVTGELKAWKDILRAKVTRLDDALRYQGKTGEQTRAEVMLYSQALRDLSGVLLSIGRLNLDARLVGIREKTADMMELAFDLALEKAGVPLDRKMEARETFRRNLKIVS